LQQLNLQEHRDGPGEGHAPVRRIGDGRSGILVDVGRQTHRNLQCVGELLDDLRSGERLTGPHDCASASRSVCAALRI
jgi:hypothetical protein